MDEHKETQEETKSERHGNRGGTTKLKCYEEMLVKSMLGTSRHNEPLQAVIQNQLNPTALEETNNSILERNRALLQYVATIANSNSSSDKFNYEFVESLVNGGADINIADQYGQSIFHEVARSWDSNVAQFLLDIGLLFVGKQELCDLYKTISLELEMINENDVIVVAIVTMAFQYGRHFGFKGCDINKQDSYGRSPLHVAAAVDYLEMTEFLLLNNADIDARTFNENQAPIHFAAKNGATKSLRVLLGYNADINSLDSKQRTPLQMAAEYTRAKAAEVLLEEGAASCLLDSSGNTALTVLIDRLPNLALEALNQLHTTDIIRMKEFYYLQFLEQSPPQEEVTIPVVGMPAQVETPATGKTPPASGKMSVKGKTSEKVKTPTRAKPVRSPLEMAVITRKFEVVTHPVMQRLIYNKWMQYGRLSTIIDLLFHVVYGILWTTISMSTPSTGKELYEPFGARIWLKLVGLVLGVMTFYDIIRQIYATMKARKSQKNWVDWRIAQLQDEIAYCHPRWPQEEKYVQLEIKRVKSLPLLNSFGAWFYLDWLVLILVLLTIATSVVYFSYDDSTTRYVYTRTISIVNLLVWLRLLKCVRPFNGIGTLVIVLGETITDFVNWAFLYLLLLIPFTAAFWINFGDVSIHPVEGYHEGNELLYTVFRISVGDDFNLDGIVEADPVMARILVALYVTAVTIVTLNLLIALLTDTFSRVYSNAVANTIMQRAIKVIDAKSLLTKNRQFKYEEYMRTNCSPEVINIEVKERSSTSDEQIAQYEVESNLLYLNELFLDRFGKVYGKNKTSDFDALFQDIKQLLIMQEKLLKDLLKIQELITMYSGNKVKFTSKHSRSRNNEKKESEDEEGKTRRRRSKQTSELEKEEPKGILSTIQEKAVSLFQKITGESEELKSISSKRERKGGRRRRRSANSEDERRERKKHRRRRPKNEDEDESTSLVRRRRDRRDPDRSEESNSWNQNTSELAVVRYEPGQRKEKRNTDDAVADEELDKDVRS